MEYIDNGKEEFSRLDILLEVSFPHVCSEIGLMNFGGLDSSELWCFMQFFFKIDETWSCSLPLQSSSKLITTSALEALKPRELDDIVAGEVNIMLKESEWFLLLCSKKAGVLFKSQLWWRIMALASVLLFALTPWTSKRTDFVTRIT